MKRWLLPLYRAAVFVGIVLLIHVSSRRSKVTESREAPNVPVEILQLFYPSAASISPRSDARGAHLVFDPNGNALGFFVVTAPDSDPIIGYSGPTNTLVAFGADGRVLGLEVLASGDTPEHLAQVVADPEFLRQFEGRSWDEMRETEQVDGVSGATLTSMAIGEGVLRRIAGKAPSLRFPKPLELADARRLFDGAAALEADDAQPALFRVTGAGGETLGYLAHSSPHSDNLIGYRGPSDVLIGLEPDAATVRGILIRDTYDTPQYVGYLEDDPGFLKLFDGTAIDAIDASGVEGVSGATMTSQTVARAVEIAAGHILASRQAVRAAQGLKPGARDFGTAAVLAFGLLMAFTRLRGKRLLRIAFQLVLIGYFGLMNGQLLSQALFVGWAQNGLAWQLAPGLILLAAAALLVPLAANRNVYCHQICPHGAAQQLLNKVRKRKLAVPHKLALLLRAIPFALLLFAVAVAVRGAAFNLVQIEPFDAYLWRAAGWATIAIAAVGLVASLFVPMAYCRYGCPTGALLTFLGANGRPDRFSRRDALALVCLAFAAALQLGA